MTSKGLVYTVEERGACNLWDFPMQQKVHDSEAFLLEQGTLHRFKMVLIAVELACPSLKCHK
jgi:hypothetical protein